MRADVGEIDGVAEPEMVRARKRYCRPLLRVGSTCTAINVTGLVYDPVQSTIPAPFGATAAADAPSLLRWETSGR